MHRNGTTYLADMYIVHTGDHCRLSYLNKFALHVLGGGSCISVPEFSSSIIALSSTSFLCSGATKSLVV